MKNITVSVPEDVYRAARIRAAEGGSSVSALVTHYLRSLEERDSEFARLEALQGRVLAEVGQFRAADRLGRDEIHERAVR
jgi:plasmid stability protein